MGSHQSLLTSCVARVERENNCHFSKNNNHIILSPKIVELREYYYDTACAFRKTHVVDGNRLKYEGFEALSLNVNS